jgi:hypothetical protein
MKYRAAKRFWARTSDLGMGLPWSSPLGLAVAYMVIRQVLMLWLAMFLGGPGWQEIWSLKVGMGLSVTGWFHITNAAVIGFVATDMRLNQKDFTRGDFAALRSYTIGLLGEDRGPNSMQAMAVIELDCDYNLRYERMLQTFVWRSRSIDETVTPDIRNRYNDRSIPIGVRDE